MVARYEHDGLNRRVKKHIDEQSPADPNGVDVYQHLLCNVRWEVVEARWNHRKGPRGSWA